MSKKTSGQRLWEEFYEDRHRIYGKGSKPKYFRDGPMASKPQLDLLETLCSTLGTALSALLDSNNWIIDGIDAQEEDGPWYWPRIADAQIEELAYHLSMNEAGDLITILKAKILGTPLPAPEEVVVDADPIF